MTWIDTVPLEKADEKIAEVYDACMRRYGFVPNIRRAQSLNPEALQAYVQLSEAVYSGGPLSAREREMIATRVSVLNKCHY